MDVRREEESDSGSPTSNTSEVQLASLSLRICQIIVPVTLCTIYVVTLVRILEYNVFTKSSGFFNKAWNKLGLTDLDVAGQPTTTSGNVINNLVLVVALVSLVVLITLVILLIFYMKWHKCMDYYFRLPALLILGLITPAYFKVISSTVNFLTLDLITFVLLTWNFTALGMMSIFGCYAAAPLSLQQFYLIHNSAILSVVLITSLPTGALYLLLIFLVIWDLFAVLAPIGPLQMIIKLAEREGVIDMPGLVYTTVARQTDEFVHSATTSKAVYDPTCIKSTQLNNDRDLEDESTVIEAKAEHSDGLGQIKRQAAQAVARADAVRTTSESLRTHKGSLVPSAGGTENQSCRCGDSIDEHGVNVGLGDFIFFSMLVGMNSQGRLNNDYYATLATFEAILVGLVITLAILATTRQVVPALPVSIGLGLAVVPLIRVFAAPFSNSLAATQIFI